MSEVASKMSKMQTSIITIVVLSVLLLVANAPAALRTVGNLQHGLALRKRNPVVVEWDIQNELIVPRVVVEGVSYALKDVTGNNTNISIPKKLSKSLPLPKPVIVVGMPKTGTTTIKSFFQQAGYRSSHWRCQSQLTDHNETAEEEFCGTCIRNAINQSLPPLQTCGGYDMWAQLDFTLPPDNCIFPQVIYLEEIHQESPRATFLLNRRNMSHWFHSVDNFHHLGKRLIQCQGQGGTPMLVPAFEGPEDKDAYQDAIVAWNQHHVQAVREFVHRHPSHALIEIDIEDPGTAEYMASLFQTTAEFWGHKNQHKSVEDTNATEAESN
ncbi:expressed unknown protein [Seminavis robusta]|uniref:Sulfotransferase n=1 Tax=Seminavis robusta TaxID=568900 RepID=A0A9N8DTT2_9STRA|nr:expressed unknown protein [Seminavis robusta]|eukprot:Sro274_g105290.1 n/a (325) ;mRNA; r:12088-13062